MKKVSAILLLVFLIYACAGDDLFMPGTAVEKTTPASESDSSAPRIFLRSLQAEPGRHQILFKQGSSFKLSEKVFDDVIDPFIIQEME
ncbi:MAG: hypothetical protein PQJ61_14460 [Spirochaetales bacterium]|uniref:Uncharacterized protein n=1 Tax=Candidatus Thalassospirochaeta sargassi TaxID=3119039 RepID=A0AAJ1IGW0_9SPIO|nr:hypothetical protein [Spirochaetales bacterium]